MTSGETSGIKFAIFVFQNFTLSFVIDRVIFLRNINFEYKRYSQNFKVLTWENYFVKNKGFCQK